MTLLLDAGALIALEHGDRTVERELKAAASGASGAITHGGVIAQVWRDGARQARLARHLAGTDVVPLDEALGRRAGSLLARCGLDDAIDAALVCLASDGDRIYTSDPGDIAVLAEAAGVAVTIVPI